MNFETESDERLRRLILDGIKRIRRLDDQIGQEAPEIERLIAEMDEWAARPLVEDSSRTPTDRRIAYRIVLWAQHGWYLSSWETPLSLISQTAEFLRDDDGYLESVIASHFESTSDKFIASVTDRHPDRATIIHDAFRAHKEQLYTLSIPAMLTQADGIASAFFGIDSIYTVSDVNFRKIRDRFDAGSNQWRSRSVQFLIGALTPLNASRKKRLNYSQPFNRHSVIHGESTSYGTRVNSLKTISWLHYVSEQLYEAEQ